MPSHRHATTLHYHTLARFFAFTDDTIKQCVPRHRGVCHDEHLRGRHRFVGMVPRRTSAACSARTAVAASAARLLANSTRRAVPPTLPFLRQGDRGIVRRLRLTVVPLCRPCAWFLLTRFLFCFYRSGKQRHSAILVQGKPCRNGSIDTSCRVLSASQLPVKPSTRCDHRCLVLGAAAGVSEIMVIW